MVTTMVAAAAAAGRIGTRRSFSMLLSWIAVVDGLWGDVLDLVICYSRKMLSLD